MEPINYGLIFTYGIQMTISFAIVLGIYTVKVMTSKVETALWYRANALRLGISFGLFWVISAGLVLVPNIAMILGSFGFNADQSAAGIGLAISSFIIGGKAEGQTDPIKVELTQAPDPIPDI